MKQEFSARTAALDDRLGVGRCFDMTARDLTIGGRRARLWVVNGYAQENILERMIAQWLSLPDLTAIPTLDAFLSRCVTACDAAVCRSREEAVLGVFSGRTLLVVDGFCGGILMDVKQFPTRSIEEPDTSRVLRGSHDGFVENLMQNAALLRRRIRDPRLTLERVQLHNDFDVLAHLTYISKTRAHPAPRPVPYGEHREVIDQILRVLADKGKGLEMNTSGVDRCGDFLPSADIFRRFREMGGQIVTVGSDAHDSSRVGQYTFRACDILKDIFGYVCTFAERKPIFHKL